MKYRYIASIATLLGLGSWQSTSLATWSYYLLLASFALITASAATWLDGVNHTANTTAGLTGTLLLSLLVGIQSPQLPAWILATTATPFILTGIYRGVLQ